MRRFPLESLTQAMGSSRRMRVLVVGAGGVGSAIAAIAERRDSFERIVLADIDLARAQRAVAARADRDRFGAAQLDASQGTQIVEVARRERVDAILNATDPRFNPQIFEAAFEAPCTYLDMALTLSEPHPERPYELPGVKLGDRQFAQDERWRRAGLLALVGIGVEPGLSALGTSRTRTRSSPSGSSMSTGTRSTSSAAARRTS